MPETFPDPNFAPQPAAQGDTARRIDQNDVQFELHAGSYQEQGVAQSGVVTNREDLQLFGVTDGIDRGRPGAGAKASAYVAQEVEGGFGGLKAGVPQGPRTIEEGVAMMRTAFVQARRHIREPGVDVEGGGATATYGWILGDERGDPNLVVGHVGRTRMSLVRNGQVHDLLTGRTESDAWNSIRPVSDPEEASQHDVADTIPLEYGDRVVVYSDKVSDDGWGMIQEVAYGDMLQALTIEDPQAAAQAYVEAGKKSAVVVDVLPADTANQQPTSPRTATQPPTPPRPPAPAPQPAPGNTGNLPPTSNGPESAEDEPTNDIRYWPLYPEGSLQDEAYALHDIAKRNRAYVAGDLATADRSNDHLSASEKVRLAHYFNPDNNGQHRSEFGRLLTAATTSELTYGKLELDDNGQPKLRVLKDPNGRDLYDNVPGGIRPRVELIVHPLEPDDPPYNETPPPPVEITPEVYAACEALNELYLVAEAKRALPLKIPAIDSVSLRDAAQRRAVRHSLDSEYDARPWTVLMGGDPLTAHLVYQDRELSYMAEQLANRVVNGRLKGRVVVR